MFLKQMPEDVTFGEFIKKDDTVSCHECKCLLKKEDAQVVLYHSLGETKYYFCGAHRKPYNKVVRSFVGPHTSGKAGVIEINKYYGEVEMTEDGTPIVKAKVTK